MTDSISLGTISADVTLDLAPLKVQTKVAFDAIQKLSGALGGLSNFKLSPEIVEAIAEIGDVARIVTGDIKSLQIEIAAFKVPPGLAKISEAIAKIGVNAVSTSKAIGDVDDSLLAAGVTAIDAAKTFTLVKDSLKSLQSAGNSAAASIGRLDKAATDGIVSVDDFGASVDVAGQDAVIAAAKFDGMAASILSVANAGRRATISVSGIGAATPSAIAGKSRGIGAVGSVLSTGANAATAVTIGAGAAAFLAGKMDTVAQQLAGNTTMTAQDVQAMKSSALSGLRSGALNWDDTMKGFMHIVNHAFHGEEAGNIERYSIMANIGTGASTKTTANANAIFLHEMNLPATVDNVSKIANMLHMATADSNTMLDKLAKYGARGVGAVIPLGAKAPDALAAIAALIQNNGGNAAQAATGLQGLVQQIMHPTTKKQLAMIQDNGLSDYYGADALKKHSIYDIVQKTNQALGGDKDKLFSIFPATRGGRAAAILSDGVGKRDYTSIYGNLQDAYSGKVKAVETRYEQAQNTPGQQWKKLVGSFEAAAEPLGEKLLPVFLKFVPVLEKVGDVVLKLLDGFTRLPIGLQEAIIGIGALNGVIKALAVESVLSRLGAGIVGGLGKLSGVGEAGAGLAEIVPVIAVVTAGVATLAIAWNTNLGAIRQTTAAVVRNVTEYFSRNMPEIQQTVKTVLGFVEEFWKAHGARISIIARNIFNAVGTVVTNALNVIEGVIGVAMDIVNGKWSQAWTRLWMTVENAWKGIGAVLSDLAKAIGNTFLLIAEILADALNRLGDAGVNIGLAIVHGVVNGIKQGWKDVTSTMAGLGNSAANALASALEVNSPSKVTQRIGEFVGDGFVLGIRSKISEAVKAAKDLAHNAANAVSTASSDATTNPIIKTQAQYSKLLRTPGLSSSQTFDIELYETQAIQNDRRAMQKKAEETLGAHQNRMIDLMRAYQSAMINIQRSIDVSTGKTGVASQTRDSDIDQANTNMQSRFDALHDWAAKYGIGQSDTHYRAEKAGILQEHDAAVGAANDEYQSTIDKTTQSLNSFIASLTRATARNSGTVNDLQAQRDDTIASAADQYDADYAQSRDYAKTLGVPVNDPRILAAVRAAVEKRDSSIDAAYSGYNTAASGQNLTNLSTKFTNDQTDYTNGIDTAHQYAAVLADLAVKIRAAYAATPDGLRTQATLLKQVSDAAKAVNDQLSQMPKWAQEISASMSSAFGSAVTRGLDNLGNKKNREPFWKGIGNDLRNAGRQEFNAGIGNLASQGMHGLLNVGLKALLGTGKVGGLLSGLFGGKSKGVAGRGESSNAPLYVSVVSGKDIAAGQSVGASVANMFGKSAIGGGGSLMKGLASSALSFLPGGGLASGLFKNLLHFSGGGVVPGVGFHDSVLAAVRPGEHIFTPEQMQSGGRAINISVVHHGDVNNVSDIHQMHADWGNDIWSQLQTGRPVAEYSG